MRFLDGVVFAVFLLIVSGGGLCLFGEFYKMCVVTKAKDLGYFSTFIEKSFPFAKKRFEFSLTHIILFAILICILSMKHHPAQDVRKKEVEKKQQKQKKKEAKAEDDSD
eukprot:CAMPEP_0194495934 /NCGR_PEP_ID=MMETSP0253-20130528/13375_1 /TAXON_ID=2966 /ORGANISM="Noctiluca scintillans" /LENGTH=108 /DNA_ID=CAMNT_0039337267 /DNA_START=109 /DNA_END=435 /DNA_ORIENTATION=-